MQQQQHFDESVYAPSFNCYSSDSRTFKAVAKVIHEQPFHDFVDDFEFSLSDEDVSVKEIDSRDSTRVFPVFNRDLLVKGEIDDEIKATDYEMYAYSSAVTGNSLRKLFIGEREKSTSSSSSSSEADDVQSPRSRSYCVWMPKADGGSSPVAKTTWKKSNSTGSSGSKRWIFRYLLRRSNSEGKKPMVLLSSKKLDSPKLKGKSREVLKAQSPEEFYAQRRAENEAGKRKSYLPYRTDVVGLFANNANGGWGRCFHSN
ncbi:hypothetical protein QVD17_04646 [Tagetes erecta]|uniref:Uncharacterized protein n=1 Tax=Tagetes erecta TaxID=13708 RepID=A0AAD8LJY8_TARER|nr:hypothetical protein QVD17_04646 [Tagetes erecta]